MLLIISLLLQHMILGAHAAQCQWTETAVMTGSTYYGLQPTEQYVFFLVKDAQNELTDRKNLLYIDQQEANTHGSVSFTYPGGQYTGGATVLCGKPDSAVQELTWALEADGTLKIWGSAPIQPSVDGISPWYTVENKVTAVWLDTTVNKIGANAFSGCSNLTTITFTGNAPVFSESCFRNIEATIVYPKGNATWTNDILQNYGGTMTWSTCNHAYPPPVFNWDSAFSCKAVFTCQNCCDSQIISCTVTSRTTTTADEVEYTAKATLNGRTYTDTKTVTVEHTIHTATAQWLSDRNTHWKQCTGCEEKLEATAHIPGPAATETTSQKCTVCGFVIRIPLGLDWFADSITDPDSPLWASGYYAQIMEQYGASVN